MTSNPVTRNPIGSDPVGSNPACSNPACSNPVTRRPISSNPSPNHLRNVGAASPRHSDVAVGDVLPRTMRSVSRRELIHYAAAAGDLNTIHWDDQAASAAGLPDVIAHGMLTMALGGVALTSWAGDPGAVQAYQARFTKPVVVPRHGSVEISVDGRVVRVLPDSTVEVELTVSSAGQRVLGRASAIVSLP